MSRADFPGVRCVVDEKSLAWGNDGHCHNIPALFKLSRPRHMFWRAVNYCKLVYQTGSILVH